MHTRANSVYIVCLFTRELLWPIQKLCSILLFFSCFNRPPHHNYRELAHNNKTMKLISLVLIIHNCRTNMRRIVFRSRRFVAFLFVNVNLWLRCKIYKKHIHIVIVCIELGEMRFGFCDKSFVFVLHTFSVASITKIKHILRAFSDRVANMSEERS